MVGELKFTTFKNDCSANSTQVWMEVEQYVSKKFHNCLRWQVINGV